METFGEKTCCSGTKQNLSADVSVLMLSSKTSVAVTMSSNKALVLRHLMPSAGTKCNFIYIFLLWVYVHMKKKLYCSNKYLK